MVEVLLSTTSGLEVVAVVRLHDEYLDYIAEMPYSWPPAALQAQAITARGFAPRRPLAGVSSQCSCHVNDSARSQVFAGWPTAAVPESVVAALQRRGLAVTRVWGADRFATAAQVAREVKRATGFSRYWTVLASGETANLVDALAASGPAAAENRPIVLTRRGSLPAVSRQVLGELAPPNLLVVGGSSAVAESVVGQVRPLAGTVQRAGGADRYGTAVAVARAFFGYLPIQDDVAIASGNTANLVDALAAGSLGRAVVLVTPGGLPRDTRLWLSSTPQVRRVTVVGGSAVVSDRAAWEAVLAVP